VVVAQCPVGVEADLGTEQAAGFALELEHVEQVTVVGEVAAEPAGGSEGETGDAVPGSELAQLGSMGADLQLGGGRQMRRLGEWLAHAASLTARGGIARELDKTHPGAAASLREGMTETLTVLRLGVPPTLARTLRSTNNIESMIRDLPGAQQERQAVA
jgi:hypothetical protein